MRRRTLIAALAFLPLIAFALPGCAQPSTVVLPNDASTDHVLDALDARGKGMKDFTADVKLDEVDTLTGDTTTLNGKVWFQDLGAGNSRIRVAFTSKSVGGKLKPGYHQEYVLDKGWLLDRDYKRKIEVNRQVLKPGQKINLLKLGEGPFPLPVGQPKEEVLKMFDVKPVATGKNDPADTTHIELIPHPKSQFSRKFKKLDVWVDRKTHFPVRIGTIDPRETTERNTDLTGIKINTGVGDDDFKLTGISDDWTRKTEPMDTDE